MWKTILGRCIYESNSGFQVHQNARYRWLTTGNHVLQTLINRRHPEKIGLEYISPLVQMVLTFPGDCCLLGLGGGGIPHALFPALANANMVAVDSSQDVIDIATKYFKTDRVINLTTIHQNAQDFVQSISQTYQHIIIDVYNSNHYPIECNNDAFFTHCKALLKPEGIMTINLIDLRKQWPLFQRIRNQFNNCTITVPIKGTSNSLVFAFNLEKSRHFLNKIGTIQCIKSLVWDPLWGCIGQFR